jgi:hypothetical protein
MKFYNELEQSWRKLKQDHPEVAKAIRESDNIEKLFSNGEWNYIADPLWSDNSIYRAPMQTEADKFLAKWVGKKIWQEGMWRHAYYLVTDVMDHNKAYIKDQEGRRGHIVLRASDDWQLWESPIKLDTRRVAGWWCNKYASIFLTEISNVTTCGTALYIKETQHNITELDEKYKFSKDPMKPLDQWQTLEEICGGES